MIYTDILEMYSLCLEYGKFLEKEEYSKAFDVLRNMAKILVLRKNTANPEWKLKITELLLIGISTPLKIFAEYEAEDLELPKEAIAIIVSDLDSLHTGLVNLLVPSDVLKFKFYPN